MLLPERDDYTILPKGGLVASEPETRLQRLRRLMFEVQELGEEIDSIKAEEDKEITENGFDATTLAARKRGQLGHGRLLKQVNNLQKEIGRLTQIVENAPDSSLLSEGGKAAGTLTTHIDSRKSLMTQLSAFKSLSLESSALLQQPASSTGAKASDPYGLPASTKPATNQSNGGDFVTYELFYTPETARLTQLEKVHELEARLASLEKIIGVHILQGMDNGDDSVTAILQSTGSLSGALDRLEHHLSLLTQPRQLDTLTRRLKSLIADMEKVLELRKKQQLEAAYPYSRGAASHGGVGTDMLLANGTATDLDMHTTQTETEKRVAYLFKSLEKLDPVIGVIPHLISRLQALRSLHTEAATFSDSLRVVSEEQLKVRESAKQIEESLKRLESNMKENAVVVERNMQSLDQRVLALMDKLQK
jgi:DNA repair exonuclease SbcCD ATPase subunit